MPEQEDIDYKGVAESLQKENEQLRARLIYLKARNPWLDIFSWENVKALLLSPYFIIGYVTGVAVAMLLYLAYYQKGTA